MTGIVRLLYLRTNDLCFLCCGMLTSAEVMA